MCLHSDTWKVAGAYLLQNLVTCDVHGFSACIITVIYIYIITTTDKYLSSGCENFRCHLTYRRSRQIATGK